MLLFQLTLILCHNDLTGTAGAGEKRQMSPVVHGRLLYDT